MAKLLMAIVFLGVIYTALAGIDWCRDVNFGRCVGYAERNACHNPPTDPALSARTACNPTCSGQCVLFANLGCSGQSVTVGSLSNLGFPARSFLCN